MDNKELIRICEEFLGAWNTQDVEKTVACYTEDLFYVDPNTRGPVQGQDAMRRYLLKLFANWKMHWALREAHAFRDTDGAAVRWHATFQKPGGGKAVECDGMDFVIMEGGKIKQNEVYFDRTILAPLLD